MKRSILMKRRSKLLDQQSVILKKLVVAGYKMETAPQVQLDIYTHQYRLLRLQAAEIAMRMHAHGIGECSELDHHMEYYIQSFHEE